MPEYWRHLNSSTDLHHPFSIDWMGLANAIPAVGIPFPMLKFQGVLLIQSLQQWSEKKRSNRKSTSDFLLYLALNCCSFSQCLSSKEALKEEHPILSLYAKTTLAGEPWRSTAPTFIPSNTHETKEFTPLAHCSCLWAVQMQTREAQKSYI